MSSINKNNGSRVKFKKRTLNTKSQSKFWIIFITMFSFLSSGFLLYISKRIFENVHYLIAIIVLLIIVFVGIISDIIGVAVAAADETPFHAMASRKRRGAKQSIRIIRNADRVATFANDVVGDICGVISGAASALIVIKVASMLEFMDAAVFSLVLSGLVAALTVGGKALGKTYAICKSNYIVYNIGVILDFVKRYL